MKFLREDLAPCFPLALAALTLIALAVLLDYSLFLLGE